MNTSNIIIALEIMAKGMAGIFTAILIIILCVWLLGKLENKYSNISIALLFSSPTKKRAKVTCIIDLGSIFLLERFVNNYTNRVGCRSECTDLKSTFFSLLLCCIGSILRGRTGLSIIIFQERMSHTILLISHNCINIYILYTLENVSSTNGFTFFGSRINSLISTRLERFSLLQVVQVSVNLHAH